MKPKLILVLLATAMLVVAAVAPATAGSASGNGLKRRGPSCPAHYRQPRFTDYRALHRVMVPRKPTRLVACRYAGLNAKDPQALQGYGIIPRGKSLHRVVRAYNKLPKPSGPSACPADDGHEITMRFRYRHRPDAYVQQAMTGCRIGTNGHRSVTAFNKRGHRLLRLLRKLSGA
jgi:hypothetical protein